VLGISTGISRTLETLLIQICSTVAASHRVTDAAVRLGQPEMKLTSCDAPRCTTMNKKQLALFRSFALAGVLSSFGLVTATGAASFSLIDVGDPGMGPLYSAPANPKINNAGQVAYTLHTSPSGDYAAIFYSGGMLTPIPTLFDGMDTPGHDNAANDINDDGYVVGNSRINSSSAISHAFVSNNGISSTDISPFAHDDYSDAIKVNNSGVVLGFQDAAGPGDGPYFLYSISANTTTDLTPVIPAGANVIDLNNIGALLGSSAGVTFYYDGAVNLIPAITGSAVAVNDNGEIAGKDGDNVFLYSGGVVNTIGSHSDLLFVEALNNSGTVVGTFDSGIHVLPEEEFADSSLRAFATLGGGLIDLNTQIDPTLGWTLITANDINDLGQITGIGIRPDGSYHPYILTPVPEPTTYGLGGAVMLGVWIILRHRRRARHSF
jgi:hypothetical protein